MMVRGVKKLSFYGPIDLIFENKSLCNVIKNKQKHLGNDFFDSYFNDYVIFRL